VRKATRLANEFLADIEIQIDIVSGRAQKTRKRKKVRYLWLDLGFVIL
jgi:hypothetical protein